jgi:zinc protease
MKSAPEPLAPVPFAIPQPFRRTLSNGLRVVVFESDRLPLVSFRLAFLSGDAGDPEDSIGLTSAIASMLTEGTHSYSSRELAEKIERLGAHLSAHASDDFFIISASALSIYTDDILDLIAEVVFRPTFPEGELDLYKRNTIENLKFQRSQPGFLAGEQVARKIYGEHPYSRVSPTAASIEALSRDALAAHHSKTLIPNNAVFVVVGDVEAEEITKRIEGEFGHWPQGEIEKGIEVVHPERREATLTIVDRPGSAQSNIVLANPGIDRLNPDYFPILLMNQILGAGASSRVFMNLREEKGYTYGAYTRLDTRRFGGAFEATAEVRTQVTGDSLKEFFYELNRIRDERVGDDELSDAKNFLTGVFPIRAETQEGLTNLIVNQQLYGLPDDYLQTYRSQVDAVTAEQVQEAARRYIDPEKIAIVIVGDGQEVLAQASAYAKQAEVFDTEGSPKELAEFSATAPAANVNGQWEMSIDFQGQEVSASIMLQQADGRLDGTINTPLGGGEINAGRVRGNQLSATAMAEIQGQDIEVSIAGEIDGDTMKGSISAAMMPEPLVFTAKRAAAG